MRTKLTLGAGGSALNDAAAFVDAWERAERGETVRDRVVSFESWEGLSSVMSQQRLELLRHLHTTLEVSDEALARALSRNRMQVASDIEALESAGLVERSQSGLRVTADAIETEILL